MALEPEPAMMHTMDPTGYRIVSDHPFLGSLLPPSVFARIYADRSLAVALAVKSVADPSSQEVRVVEVPGGQVVFRSTASALH